MTILARLSVRTILVAVFVTLALALCGALLFQIDVAWQAASLARRLSVLASVDESVFKTSLQIRSDRAKVLSLIQDAEDATASITAQRKTIESLYKQTVAATARIDIPEVDQQLAVLQQHWGQFEALWSSLEDYARKPKAGRNLDDIQPWYLAMETVLGDATRLSLVIDNEARIADPAIAELIQIRQLGWGVRFNSGLECGVGRRFLNTSAPLSAQARSQIDGYRGGADFSLAMLTDVIARPGVPADLAKLAAAERDAEQTTRAGRDGIYQKISQPGHALVPAAEWDRICVKPLGEMVKGAMRSLDLMQDHARAVQSAADQRLAASAVALAIALLISVCGVVLVRHRVTAPVRLLTEAIGYLAKRDYTMAVPKTGCADEFGTMAETLEALRVGGLEAERLTAAQMAAKEAELKRVAAVEACCRDFDASIRAALSAVNQAADQMTTTANGMTTTAERTAKQSTVVAAASEEASSNVQTVASAAEELAASISEISRQVSQAAKVAGDAAARAARTNESIQGLAAAAQKIGDVVKLINDIAGQTNLLALNATIEAARAGEAGKGFAVVASEVKGLASQTAKATEDIAVQVAGIQASTREAVSAIRDIGAVIGQVNEISTTIAAAVEEQGAATHEIARNAQEAAKGTTEVSSNIAGVNLAAGETGSAAGAVLAAAQQVAAQSDSLRGQLDDFLKKIRAA